MIALISCSLHYKRFLFSCQGFLSSLFCLRSKLLTPHLSSLRSFSSSLESQDHLHSVRQESAEK